MAITKLMCIGESSGNDGTNHLYKALRYIANPEKTQDGKLVGALNTSVDWKTTYYQMLYTKKSWGKEDKRQGYHFIISFSPNEDVDAELALKITKEFVERYLDEYETLYSVHDDRDHLHGHIIFNSVNRVTGFKYHYNNGDWRRDIQPIVNDICDKHGLSTIDLKFDGFNDVNSDDINSGTIDSDDNFDAAATSGNFAGGDADITKIMLHGRRLNKQEWEERKAGIPTWADFAAADIDAVLPSCNSFDEVVAALKKIGWYVHTKTQDGSRDLAHYVMYPPLKGSRGIRPDVKCGYGYSKKGIEERIEKKIYNLDDHPDMKKQKRQKGTSGNFAGGGDSEEGWSWEEIYRSNNYNRYSSDYASPTVVRIQKYPKGYKPRLTNYQKKYVASLYRTGKMQRLQLNKIPMEYRPAVREVKQLQKETNYVLRNNIRTPADTVDRMLKIQREIQEVNRKKHDLYNIRWGTKEGLAFAYYLLKADADAPEETKTAYERFAKNLERQDLAAKIIPYLETSGKIAGSEDVREIVHEIFETGDYTVETEEGFLKYLKADKADSDSEWADKNIKRLEKMAYSKIGRDYKAYAMALMNDDDTCKCASYADVKKQLESMIPADAEPKKKERQEQVIRDFIRYMSKMQSTADTQPEEIKKKLLSLIAEPEQNTKAIAFVKELRKRYPDNAAYQEALKRVFADGGYSVEGLDQFMEEFNRGEKELDDKKKKLMEEWEICQSIRRQQLNLPTPPRQKTKEQRYKR